MGLRSVVAIATLAALTGCVPAWVSPTRDDAATLAFVGEESSGFVHPYVFVNGRECRERRKVSLPGIGYLKGRGEIRIPSGEEFTALATIADGSWTCNVAGSFLPRARQSYTVLIQGSGQKCRIGIFREEGKKLVPEPTARPRKWKQPTFSNSEAQCRD